MDPSIIKFLDEDEFDETMHSGADIEAFTAALNRDIEGDNTSASQPPTTTDAASALFQGTNHTPSELFQQWQSSIREEEIKAQIQEHQSSPSKVNRNGSGSEIQHPPNDTSRGLSHVPSKSSRPQDDQHNVHMSQALNTQNTKKNPDQKIQKMDNQQPANAMNQQSDRPVPFGVLLPVIQPKLDKDRAMQLMDLYTQLKNNNITKEAFVPQMKALVGDHLLKMALYKPGQVSAIDRTRKPSPNVRSSTISDSSSQLMDNNGSAIKQQQQCMPFTHASFPTYGNHPKNPSVRQKPLEAPVCPLTKKQKVSGAYSDQIIEQLNDVTAVGGVNLREEEEQLFPGSNEERRVSDALRKVVQQEEERLILQKVPLQNKLAEIMAKCGVKNRSNDVERCLSLCVEERMRGLIGNLIRLSKQRVYNEKRRHRTVITSDIRQQIISMNQKAREEWEKKQTDAEKLKSVDEPDGSGDVKSFKTVNKEEDDKMRTAAANVAALAAVGGDDRLSKWQLMAEQSREKRVGGPDRTCNSQPSVDVQPQPKPKPKPKSTLKRNFEDHSDSERTSGPVIATLGLVRKSLRYQDLAHRISVKDVISVLGREIQMSRSPLIYCLYEKVPSDLQGST